MGGHLIVPIRKISLLETEKKICFCILLILSEMRKLSPTCVRTRMNRIRMRNHFFSILSTAKSFDSTTQSHYD